VNAPVTFNDIAAARAGVSYRPIVIVNACGTGVSWNIGYPFDLAQALVDAGLPYVNQPIFYGPGGVPTAFPMQPSIDSGTVEGLRLIRQVWADYDLVLVGYSQGALVIKAIWDALTGLEKAHVKAAVTFGNPAREAHHTFPGGIDPGGHGIVTPNMVDTPAWWWDFACGAAMGNSPGQDLYATCGYDGNATAVADEEAIWQIVDKGTLSSGTDLAVAILSLIPHPLSGGIAVVRAVLDAGLFFIKEGLTPHTSYQTVQPIAGDPRDCWRIALDYLGSVGLNRFSQPGDIVL
jgi:hypothetical protein